MTSLYSRYSKKKRIGHHPKGQTWTNRFSFSYSAWRKKIVCKQNTTTSFQSSKLWEKRDITNHLTRNDNEKKKDPTFTNESFKVKWFLNHWNMMMIEKKYIRSSTLNEHTNESVNWRMANWRRILVEKLTFASSFWKMRCSNLCQL